MSLFIIRGLKHYSGEMASRPSLVVGLTLIVAAIGAILRVLVQDFRKAFFRRPAHFMPIKFALLRKPPRVDIPYPNTPYKIKHYPGEIVILPHIYIDEIKNAAATSLSFQQGSFDLLVGQHTGITVHDISINTLIRRDVGRLLDRVYTIVDTEALRALQEEIGPCEDWTEVVLFPKVVNTIVKISQRVFVGEPLCRTPRWLETVTLGTAASFASVTELWKHNAIMRPFYAWRHPGLATARRHKAEARELLKPVLENRLKEMESPDFKPPPDLIQLVIESEPEKGRDLDYQLTVQLGVGRAALFTTGTTVTHLLYDLCAHSEYVEPLRREVLALGKVPFNRVNVDKLTKLDSFIRECQRWNKFMLIGTMRKVIKDLKLPNGVTIPAGAVMAVDTQNAVFENSTLENPYEFDGYRWHNMRHTEGNEHNFQAVQPNSDHLVFGYGSQSCPGRHFAIHEAKVALARMLINYEKKLKDPKTPSPMSHVIGILTMCDPTVKFLFKRRKDTEA